MIGCYLGGMQFKLTEDDSRGRCYGEAEVETESQSSPEIFPHPCCRCIPHRDNATFCLCFHTT